MLQKLFPELKKKDLVLHGIVLLGLLGMACILLSSLLSPKTEQTAEQAVSSEQETYRLALQEQLTEMLTSISGVGQAEVLVTLEGSEQYRYAQDDDRTVSDTQVRSSTSYVTVGGSREALVESVSHPGITGVVVSCEGGASSTVQEAVYKAVSVACGLPVSQIYVTRSAGSSRKENVS